MQTFRKLLDEQQNYIAHLLTEHKAEVDEKIDVSKKHTFRQKNLGKTVRDHRKNWASEQEN